MFPACSRESVCLYWSVSVIAQTLSASQALAIVDNCPYPLLVLNTGGQVIGHNRALARLLEQLRPGSDSSSQFSPHGSNPLQTLIDARGSVSWKGQGGEEYHFEVISFPLPDQGNTQARMFVDISRQTRLQQARNLLQDELMEHSLTDSLTGLLNRRGLMLALEPQVARSRRYNRPLSLIMLSLGDQEKEPSLLVGVAQLLKDQLRWADMIGYTEQHEFILVLPETNAEAAVRLADKLEHQLIELMPPPADRCCRLGIASWRKSDNAATLLKRTAQSLSQAHTGRTDCFVAS